MKVIYCKVSILNNFRDTLQLPSFFANVFYWKLAIREILYRTIPNFRFWVREGGVLFGWSIGLIENLLYKIGEMEECKIWGEKCFLAVGKTFMTIKI